MAKHEKKTRDAALEDPDNWDLETPVAYERPGKSDRRALISVPFQSNELPRVEAGADRAGMKLSAFIRTAALEKADALIEAEVYGISYTNDYNSVQVRWGDTPVFPMTESDRLVSVLNQNVVTGS